MASNDVDIAIVTIREDEFRAVLNRFPNGTPEVVDGRFYSVSETMDLDGRPYRVAISRCKEQGNSDSQFLTSRILRDLNPAYLLVVGIGGGVPSVEYSLGDVVVSTRVNDFRVGAVDAKGQVTYSQRGGAVKADAAALATFLPAIEHLLGDWNSEESIKLAVPPVPLDDDTKFYGDNHWIDSLKKALKRRFGSTTVNRPRFTDGPIDSSDFVIKDTETLARWQTSSRDAKAIDMEAAGVYAAVHDASSSCPFLVIRGLSDVVGYKRDPDWTAYACETAAAFTAAFVKTGMLPRHERAAPPAASPVPDRLALKNDLGRMIRQLFGTLVFTLNPPAEIMPADTSPQGERAEALLRWAESDGGPGFAAIRELYEKIVRPNPR